MNLFIQTLNEFFVKYFVERSKKIVFFVVSNYVETQLITKSIVEHVNQLFKKTLFNELNQKKKSHKH